MTSSAGRPIATTVGLSAITSPLGREGLSRRWSALDAPVWTGFSPASLRLSLSAWCLRSAIYLPPSIQQRPRENQGAGRIMATSAPAFRPIAQMGTRTKVIVMAGTMLGMFTAAMDQTIVGTSMPRIIADLGGFGLYSWVGTGFLLASTATVPVVGKLA